jgi:hypothetical protein
MNVIFRPQAVEIVFRIGSSSPSLAKRYTFTQFFTARDTIAAGQNDCDLVFVLCLCIRPSPFLLHPLKSLPFPGVFGVFYQNDRPTKNSLEKKMDREHP